MIVGICGLIGSGKDTIADHLVDDHYAMTISKNSSTSTNSVQIMIDFITHFDEFTFDWDTYPGNLYIGNVCKILS